MRSVFMLLEQRVSNSACVVLSDGEGRAPLTVKD